MRAGTPDAARPRGDRLDAELEAVLLVVDAPVTVDELAVAVDRPAVEVARGLGTLARFYDVGERGIELREVAGGWRLFTREEYAPAVSRLLLEGQRAKLSPAALETLAVVAYRQPVTRAQIGAIRGVAVDGVVRTLLTRGLIAEVDGAAAPGGQGARYATTPLFLDRMGLAALSELPSLAPLLPELSTLDPQEEHVG